MMSTLLFSIALIIGIGNFIYATIKNDDKSKIGALISIVVTLVGIIAVLFLDKL